MSVDPATAAATREYGGVTYYFCNPGCADKFAQNPAATWLRLILVRPQSADIE